MLLRYKTPNGEEKRIKLEKQKMTMGRGLNVDLTISDRLASRLHCCIEFRNNGWHVTDLNSRNGTFVNDQKVQDELLRPDDRLRIGDTVLVCEQAAVKGTETVIRELNDQMDSGKGFKTMLIEIVGDKKKDKHSHTDQISP